jgi:2-phospho-L-lactate guanylyltransferase
VRRAEPVPAWGVVVPVKPLHSAKSRLSAYGERCRQELALAFAVDVVRAALGCTRVARVLAVCDDDLVAQELRCTGADVVPDAPAAGLNAALVHGEKLVRAADVGVVALSADLPALRPRDLQDVLDGVAATQRAFVADAAGTGTTLLAAGRSTALRPAFGSGSRQRHLASGARQLPAGARLRQDVDTPYDLRAALRLGVGARTAAVAAELRSTA